MGEPQRAQRLAQVVLKEAPPGTLSYSLYAHDGAPRPATTIRVPNGDLSATGTAALPLNAWTHLAGTYDGTTIRTYVNGVQVGQTPATGNMVASAAPLRIGGNAVWGEYFAGLIDEVRIYRRPLAPSEIQADMNVPVGGGALPDTTPPTVSVTAPGAGTVVSGTAVSVTASASDNVGVVGVQFLLDGANLGAEDLTSPYSVSWNTTALTDGTQHVLAARARDAAGNLGAAANVTVTVNNTPDSTPPTVSLTAPAQGATLSGTVTVSATAADNVGVAGVTFLLDGAAIGSEDVTAPYSVSWNTTTATNGSHSLTARARDGAGNQTTSSPPIAVTVTNVAPPPTGLVAAYSFDEGLGSTAGDSSGLNNTGTVLGATWTASGKYGKALSFNGSSNWVTVADNSSLDLTTGMTLEAWVNPTLLNSYQSAILKEGAGLTLAYGLYTNEQVPHPASTINLGSAERTAAGTAGLALNVWTHLASTYDGATLRLFVNGVQVGTPQSITGPIVNSAGALRIGGNAVWGEYFNGRIDEVRVYNRALSAAEIQTDMNTGIGPSVPPDTTPPTVSITAPTAGSVVTGTLKVKASASDGGGIAGVQLKVDGSNYGPEDVVAPYEIDWNPGALPNGSHSLVAVARDAAGNVASSASVGVTVTLPSAASSVGSWSAPFNIGFVAVHATLMNTGKILMFPGWTKAIPMASVFDPTTNVLTPTPVTTGSNVFCAGHVTLADGRVFIFGGHDDAHNILGLQHANIFNPQTLQWTRVADMAFRRWYPSGTLMADGRVVVLSGATTCDTCIVETPEVYDPVANSWTQLPGANLSVPYYPLQFLLPNGKVLDTGSVDLPAPTRTLDVATQTWTTVDPQGVDGGSAAQYVPGKILQSGLGSLAGLPVRPATTTTYVLDTNVGSPQWRQTAPMAYGRSYHNLTILPDGSVLAIGGESETDGNDVTKAVFKAERWSPATETWSTMAAGAIPRLYHSTSLLLPDGRVFVGGGGDVGGGIDQNTVEYYSPPYLFQGARPTISSSPSTIAYGGTFFVGTPDGASIASVALIRPGSVTHGFDEDQRYVPVTFTLTTGGLNVHAPVNANTAPPGPYMLFIVNSNGVPSVAPFVRLPSPSEDSVPPTAPGSLVANGGFGSAALSWTASTDNIGVAGYNVHRSTTAGFTPGAGNLIAQPTGTSYTNTGLAAGTYYYRVIARDLAGNLSAPSNQAIATVTSDTTFPAVAMTAPANGATVSGSVSVSANASDNVAVVGVQFLLDGVALGAEDTTSPYSISWNTATATNGTHSVSARARDAAGNQTTATAVSVTVSNAAPGGLIVGYGFEEGAGTTTADASGKGHVGTLSGAMWTTSGKNGKALSFDGVNDFVSSPDAADLDLTNRMTLEAWVKPAALSDWNTVVMKEGTATTLAYSLYANNGKPRPSFTIRINADREAEGTVALPLNTWTHLAGTYDGTTMRLYVNGVQVGTRAQTGNVAASARTLRIGGNSIWGEYFNGLIDDVRIYNRALTPAEITTDMNTPVQ